MVRVLVALLILMPLPMCRAQNLARVYVYAPREMTGRSWVIACDGTPVAKLRRGTFFALNVAAGSHLLSSEKIASWPVEVQAGKESFVRVARHIDAGESAAFVFDQINAAVARNELRFVIYIEPKDAMSSAVSKRDPRPPPEERFKTRDEEKQLQ